MKVLIKPIIETTQPKVLTVNLKALVQEHAEYRMSCGNENVNSSVILNVGKHIVRVFSNPVVT